MIKKVKNKSLKKVMIVVASIVIAFLLVCVGLSNENKDAVNNNFLAKLGAQEVATTAKTIDISNNDFVGTNTQIRVKSGEEINVTNCTFSVPNSTLESVAPAIVVEGGTLNLANSVISNFGNSSNLNGGAIYISSGTVKISGSSTRIQNCKAINGGAIFVSENGKLFWESGQIQGCTASNSGGAIFNNGQTTISSGTISGCSASKAGGAIANEMPFVSGQSVSRFLKISGGSISGTAPVGSSVVNAGELVMSGSPTIGGNIAIASNTTSDVTSMSGNKFLGHITVASNLTKKYILENYSYSNLASLKSPTVTFSENILMEHYDYNYRYYNDFDLKTLISTSNSFSSDFALNSSAWELMLVNEGNCYGYMVTAPLGGKVRVTCDYCNKTYTYDKATKNDVIHYVKNGSTIQLKNVSYVDPDGEGKIVLTGCSHSSDYLSDPKFYDSNGGVFTTATTNKDLNLSVKWKAENVDSSDFINYMIVEIRLNGTFFEEYWIGLTPDAIIENHEMIGEFCVYYDLSPYMPNYAYEATFAEFYDESPIWIPGDIYDDVFEIEGYEYYRSDWGILNHNGDWDNVVDEENMIYNKTWEGETFYVDFQNEDAPDNPYEPDPETYTLTINYSDVDGDYSETYEVVAGTEITLGCYIVDPWDMGFIDANGEEIIIVTGYNNVMWDVFSHWEINGQAPSSATITQDSVITACYAAEDANFAYITIEYDPNTNLPSQSLKIMLTGNSFTIESMVDVGAEEAWLLFDGNVQHDLTVWAVPFVIETVVISGVDYITNSNYTYTNVNEDLYITIEIGYQNTN